MKILKSFWRHAKNKIKFSTQLTSLSSEQFNIQHYELEEPIRAELFSIERLEQYAATLAHEQQVSDQPTRGLSLLPRFEDNIALKLSFVWDFGF